MDSAIAVATSSPTIAALLTAALPLMAGWRAVTRQAPKPDARTASITLDRNAGGGPQHRATVQMDVATGRVTNHQPFDSLRTGRQLRSVLRFAHTGEVHGIACQTIAGLVSLASVILLYIYAGLALALRRDELTTAPRRRGAAASVPNGSAAGN